MYLVDTDVISEARKGTRANRGVLTFFATVQAERLPVFLAAVTIGELRRGVELIRHRGDERQARSLEQWLASVVSEHSDSILPFDADIAQVWGKLRVPHPNALDKQIAATALIHSLTVVTGNQRHHERTGVDVFNPFTHNP